MTIIFELRQVNDKVLIVQFQFDTHDIKINGTHIDGMSLDKFVGLDTWEQIYLKLKEPLERYGSNTGPRLKDETISMKRAQLELRVSWRSKQAFHREIVGLEMKNADMCAHVMVVKVVMVSMLDKYRKQHSQEKLSKQQSQDIEKVSSDKTVTKPKSTVRSSDESNGARTSNGSSSNGIEVDIEEYVPAGNVPNSLKYTPSAVSISNERSDEYSPTTQGADDIVSYTPTKIGDIKSYKDQNNKYKTNIKTDLNRNDCVSKKKRTEPTKIDDLFGADSDDNNDRRNANLRSASRTNHTESSKEKPHSKLDNWVTTTRHSKKPAKSTENGIPDDAQKKRKIQDVSPMSTKDEEARKLKALRESFERMEQPVTVDKILNLKDMKKVDIVETFEQHESVLRSVFNSYAKLPDQKIEPRKDELDYLMILDALVDGHVQTELYQKVRERFCPSDGITSNHENLIWKRLVPEWLLQVFMERFYLSRQDAMERLRQQEDAKNDYDFLND